LYMVRWQYEPPCSAMVVSIIKFQLNSFHKKRTTLGNKLSWPFPLTLFILLLGATLV